MENKELVEFLYTVAGKFPRDPDAALRLILEKIEEIGSEDVA
jgi:hypothetical protein